MAEQLGKFVAPKLSAAPSSPVSGQLWYDTTANKLKWYNGSEWVVSSGESGDHGLVTALPAASVGDYCTYKADKTNGVFWHLIYDGEGEKPWKKIGGPPLRVVETTARATKANTFQTTGAPSITTPLKMDVWPRYGAQGISDETAALWEARVALFIGGVESEEAFTVGSNTFDTYPMEFKSALLRSIAAGTAVQTRYMTSSTSVELIFRRLFIELDPVRVG